MTILREIHTWSKTLVAWQQDAIARLYANRVLSEDDHEDLYALAKVASGIPDPDGRVPKQLHDADVGLPPDPTRLVQLAAIKNVSYVNALAQGETLPLSPTGLTVIYGENGAGKSGYSRILKHACRARDRSEPILPDAKLDPKVAGTAQATFEVIIDGQPAELAWTYRTAPPVELADISIFDSHCARAYIDNDGDFAYVPYGLDILEGLVDLCDRLKKRALAEKLASTPTNSAYIALTGEKTAVAAALNGIPARTKAADIDALATLTEAELARLDVLMKTLAEADPKQKAQALREQVMRLTGLKSRITAAMTAVSDEKLDQLRDLIKKQKSARDVADLAAEGFKSIPGRLPGTGGEAWQGLFESARAFAVLSHEGHGFPNLPPESACPLCQNPLGAAGADRLKQFDAFIKQQAERAAREARQAAEDAYRAVHQAVLTLSLEDGLKIELTGIEAGLAESCSAYETALVARQAAVREAAGNKLAWEDIVSLPGDVRPSLERVVAGLQVQAKVLDASADEKARAAMILEKTELDARRRLAEVREAVLEAISKHELCAKLQKCITAMGTTAISRKATDLSDTMARAEVAAALNEELKKLKVRIEG